MAEQHRLHRLLHTPVAAPQEAMDTLHHHLRWLERHWPHPVLHAFSARRAHCIGLGSGPNNATMYANFADRVPAEKQKEGPYGFDSFEALCPNSRICCRTQGCMHTASETQTLFCSALPSQFAAEGPLCFSRCAGSRRRKTNRSLADPPAWYRPTRRVLGGPFMPVPKVLYCQRQEVGRKQRASKGLRVAARLTCRVLEG